ncbi:MAG: GntR family transcriptional regulator [Leptolyngbyaceae cyanobacterium]
MANRNESLPIKVNGNAPLLVITQVTEQIKLLIAFGFLNPGDSLPPVNQLAQQLGINHNTTAAIYADLVRAGYLVAQRGRGTFVAQNEEVERVTKLQGLYRQMGSAYLTAKETGLDPAEFASAAYAIATTLDNDLALVFVDYDSHSALAFLDCIESEINNSVVLSRLEDLESNNEEAISQLKEADLVLTTVLHAKAVSQHKTPGQEVIGLIFMPDPSILIYLAALPRNSKVLFINCEGAGSKPVEQLVEQMVISHLQLQAIAIRHLEDHHLQLINEFDFVYAASPMYGLLENHLSQSGKLKQFRFNLSQASIALVKARIAAARLLNTEAT